MPHPIKATKNKAGRPSGIGANAASKKLLNVAKKLLTKAADLLKHKPKKCLGGARAWSGDDLQSILLKTLKDPKKDLLKSYKQLLGTADEFKTAAEFVSFKTVKRWWKKVEKAASIPSFLVILSPEQDFSPPPLPSASSTSLATNPHHHHLRSSPPSPLLATPSSSSSSSPPSLVETLTGSPSLSILDTKKAEAYIATIKKGGTPSTFRSTLSVPPSLRPPSSSQPLRLQRPSRLSLPSPPPHPRPPSSRLPPLHFSTSSLLLHASRWDVGAIEFLKENPIEMFCLPSHSSIWSQPNDVGINKRLKKKWLKKAYGNYLRMNDNLTQGECNAIFARAGQVWA
jgi:hypothetical protein